MLGPHFVVTMLCNVFQAMSIKNERNFFNWDPACQTASAEGIDCGFKRVDGYLFPESTSKSDMDSIDKELAAAVRAGLTDVRKVGGQINFSLQLCQVICLLAPTSF